MQAGTGSYNGTSTQVPAPIEARAGALQAPPLQSPSFFPQGSIPPASIAVGQKGGTQPSSGMGGRRESMRGRPPPSASLSTYRWGRWRSVKTIGAKENGPADREQALKARYLFLFLFFE